MAGIFEVFIDGESYFRFRLKAADGTVVAVSTAFDDKSAAVAGIATVRECAGMGLVTDLCPAGGVKESAAPARPSAAAQACEDQRNPADGFRTRAKALRRAAIAPRWTGAA